MRASFARSCRTLLAPTLIAAAGACGEGPAVVVTGPTTPLGPGAEFGFTASVNGVPGAGVIWGLQEGSAAGSILADGRFTAGRTPGRFHVIAQTATSPPRGDTVTIDIIADPTPSFTDFPDSIDAAAGGQAVVTARGAGGLTDSWSIRGGTFVGGVPTDSGGAITPVDTARYVVVTLRSTNAAGRSTTIVDSARILGRYLTLPDQTYALAISSTNVIASMFWLRESVRFRTAATRGVFRVVGIASTPIHGVFSPDGASFYVVLQSSDQLGKIGVNSGVTSVVDLGHHPFNIARSEDGRTLFITTADGWLLRREASGLSAQDSVRIDAPSNGIAIRGDQLWVSTFGGRLYRVDPASLELIDSVRVGGSPQRIALNATATTLYVANEGAHSYQVVNTATKAFTSLPAGGGGSPVGTALSPDGSEVWFGVRDQGRVDRFDARTMALLGSIDVGGSPRDITFSDDGHFVLIGAESHSLLVRR